MDTQREEQQRENREQKKSPIWRSISPDQVLLTGGTLLTTGVADAALHLDGTGAFVGLLATFVVARHSNDILDHLVPGREAARVRALTERVVNAATPTTEEEDDQAVLPKLRRLFGLKSRTPALPSETEADDTIVVSEEEPETDELYEMEALQPNPARELTAQQYDGTVKIEDQAQHKAKDDATLVYVARDPRLALSLAPRRFLPDVNIVLREGIFACGCKGSGKTGVLAKIIEQIMLVAERLDPARRGIPGVVFDKEGDLESLLEVLPNGRLADQEHWYSAAEIIEQRLQVVVNLQAWLKDEDRAAVIIYLVNDLITYTSGQEQSKRLPCPVFLDEAQYWLPQESVSYLSRETQRKLIDAFNILLSTGRKRGLTPFIFTQRIAQIDKSTISLGIQIFMRQVIDNDQKRCMDYIRSDVIDDKKNLAQLSEGQGVVCLPGGVQLLIQFDERQSTHLSHAPTIDRVLACSVQAAPAQPSYAQPVQAYQPPAYSATRSVRPEQIAWQPEPEASLNPPGAAPGMPRAFATQQDVRQAQPGLTAQAQESRREADKTQHFTKGLGPELQAAYDAFRPSMRHHTLARYLGTTPSLAGQLLKQLQARGYIDSAGNKTMVSLQENPGEYDREVAVWHELEAKQRANVRDFAVAMNLGETKAWELLSKLDRLGLIHWERRKKKGAV